MSFRLAWKSLTCLSLPLGDFHDGGGGGGGGTMMTTAAAFAATTAAVAVAVATASAAPLVLGGDSTRQGSTAGFHYNSEKRSSRILFLLQEQEFCYSF